MSLLVKTNKNIIFDKSNKINDLLENFIINQDVKQSSKDLYKRTLKLYFNWIESKNYQFFEITRVHLLKYKTELLELGMSSLTVGSYITSVRRFYEWTEANKLYPNIAKGIKSPKRKQQFKKQPLMVNQAKNLLNYYAKAENYKNFAIVNLLLRTGLRTIEVSRANVEDIVFKGFNRVLLIHGKGRDEKDNFVILTDKTYNPIKNYLNTRKDITDNIKIKSEKNLPLFVSDSNNNKGKRLSTRTISSIAKKGLRAIGLDENSFTAHSLRHTTAVNILRAGGNLEAVQFTLRHSNIATTQIYTSTLDEERRLQNNGETLIDDII
jgi:integrase/recombinase XerC/integrase/recombinase XerD